MSQKANTPRTRIADLPEVNAVSTEELNEIEGGGSPFGHVVVGVIRGLIEAQTTHPGSITNPGETDTATDIA